jgi:murein DD-endopeptidase MepM/ murein hydrolase activator NlpD
MTGRAVLARVKVAERVVRERWFPERQIIVREGARARALRLSPTLQMTAAAALLVGTLWSAGATIGYVANEASTAFSQAENQRLRAAYGDLIDEVSRQHSKVLDITQDLEHYRSYLLTLLDQNQNLRRDLRNFASALDGAEGESQRADAAEQALKGQLEGMANELAGVSNRNERLQSDVSEMRVKLLDGEDERARFAAARAAIDRRMARLEQDASGAQNRTQELERALTARQQLVDQAQAARRTAVQDRDQIAAKLADAEARLQAMAQSHEQALTKLSEQTRNTITEVERIVGAAGLDPKRLVPQRGDVKKQSRGGPFVPWNARRAEPDTPGEDTTQALHTDIARLDELRRLLRVIPLASPVRAGFSITSTFGYRHDPFNNLGALHEGIDMQAPLRTPVYATAPGKVVFAGWHASYGRMLEIDHGYGIRTRYAHLDRIEVQDGAEVGFGNEIGLIGSSGRTSGTHLHYEVLVDGRSRNPLNFLRATADVRKSR